MFLLEKSKREVKTSFAKQAAILAAASLFVRLIGFIYRIILTNLIGDVGNGVYGAGYNIYNFFLIVSSAGLPAAISKMVSERMVLKQYRNAYNVFKVSLAITFISGTIGGLSMWFGADFFANQFNMPRSALAIKTLAPTIFIVAIMSSFRGYFQGMKTTTPTAISQVIEQIFNAVFSVVLAFILFNIGSKENPYEAVNLGAAGGTAGTGIGALAGLLFLIFAYIVIKPTLSKKSHRNLDGSKPESSYSISSTLIKTAIVIVTGTAIISVTNIIDMKMVIKMLEESNAFSNEQIETLYGQLTGKYSTLTTLPVALSTAFATAVVPNIAEAVTIKDRKGIRRKINSALRLTMLISIPAAIGLGVLGNQILYLLFPKYLDGGILLQVGSMSVIFLSLSQIATGILQGIGKAHFPVITIFLGAIVKIVLNYLLISNPKINIVGSVISTTGCYMVASVIDLWALSRYTHTRIDIKSIFIKPLISAFSMSITCILSYKGLIYLLNLSDNPRPYFNNAVATLTAIFIAMITYAVVMLLIKGVTKNDIKLFPFGNKILALLLKFNIKVV